MADEKENPVVNPQVTDAVTKPSVMHSILCTGKDIVNDIDDKIVAILTLGAISVVSIFILKDPTNIVLTSVGAIGGLALGRRGNGGTSNGNSNGNGNGYSNGAK